MRSQKLTFASHKAGPGNKAQREGGLIVMVFNKNGTQRKRHSKRKKQGITRRRMRVASGQHKYTTSDVGNVDVQVALGREDANIRHHVWLANQAKELFVSSFKARGLRDVQDDAGSPNNNKLTLHINIVRCSDGSRAGRMCFGELGMGWALLFLRWRLSNDQTKDTVLGPFEEKFRDSAAAGCADLCDPMFGDNTVKRMASILGPNAIDKKIIHSLPAGTTS